LLVLHVPVLRLLKYHPDTPDGLNIMAQLLVTEWNNVRVPLHTDATAIAWLEKQFVVKRVQDGKDDIIVCTLHDAIRSTP
jgi:hypothetical protein